MEWDPDRGLQVRMGMAVVLVALFPILFFSALLWVLTDVLPWVVATLTRNGSLPGPGSMPGFALPPLPVLAGVTAGSLALQYAFGERFALRGVRAQVVQDSAYPEVHSTLARLSHQVDVPTPDLAVMDTEMPNAFATGRSQSHSTVVVSTGLLDALDDDELAAVLAHELAHVKNRDVTVMSLAYLLPSITVFVATTAYRALSVLLTVVGDNLRLTHSDDDGVAAVVVVVAVFVLTAVLTFAVSALFWVVSFLVYRLLSRYRERAADRGAARITGDPASLASALRTIDEELASVPDRDLRRYDGGIEALYLSPLETEVFTDGEDALISRDVFPATHPPTEERIERLRDLQRTL